MEKNASNYRWRILALLFFATTINYIDRQVIGMLKPFIASDLGWTEAGYGYIVTGFQVAYAIGLLLSGLFWKLLMTMFFIFLIAGFAYLTAWMVLKLMLPKIEMIEIKINES